MARSLLLVFVLALAGCAGKPIEQMDYSESRALAKTLHERCAAQGFPIGHAENEACIQQELRREASIRNAAAERRQNTVVCNRVFNTVICN